MKNSKKRTANLNHSVEKCCEGANSQQNRLSDFDWKNLGLIKMRYSQKVNLQY